MGQVDETGEGTAQEALARDVFKIADIAKLGDTVPKRWVMMPEFGGKSVCVWGTRREDRIRAEEDAAIEDDPRKAYGRRVTALIIDCVRDGDGQDAERIFNRLAHWAFIDGLPTSAQDRLYNTIQELDLSGGITEANILDFFAITASLKGCLESIASHCGVCTDCPQNSLPTCPQQALALLGLPKKS